MVAFNSRSWGREVLKDKEKFKRETKAEGLQGKGERLKINQIFSFAAIDGNEDFFLSQKKFDHCPVISFH